MSDIEPRSSGPERAEHDGNAKEGLLEAPGRDSGPETLPDAEAETERDRIETKKKISEVIWAGSAKFVGHVFTHGLMSRLRGFLKRFSELDDDALATEELRRTRERARQEAGDDDRT